MDEIAVSYPPKFWDKIKYLRPERTTKIPNECYMDNGTVTADTTFLKQKWKSEFSNLYNPNVNYSFDSEFRKSAVYQILE